MNDNDKKSTNLDITPDGEVSVSTPAASTAVSETGLYLKGVLLSIGKTNPRKSDGFIDDFAVIFDGAESHRVTGKDFSNVPIYTNVSVKLTINLFNSVLYYKAVA